MIDADAVRNFIGLIHERAAGAIAGFDVPPAVLQLCTAAPDDSRFYTQAYNVGDVDRMIENALLAAENKMNVYTEGRLTRPGLPHERGRAEATLAVFGLIGEHDGDSGKPFAGSLPPSIVVETSPPANEHCWFFLRHAIGLRDAVDLGKAMRRRDGGDHCTGNPVQPFRVCGTPNFPSARKRARGRVTVPTRLVMASDVTYTMEKLVAHYSGTAPPPIAPAPRQHSELKHERPAYCRSKARAIFAAEPAEDRSAQFMSAVRHAAWGNMSVEEIEGVARQNPHGCAGKYLEHGDRLAAEIARCFAKFGADVSPVL